MKGTSRIRTFVGFGFDIWIDQDDKDKAAGE
jgi:hypothetical protein